MTTNRQELDPARPDPSRERKPEDPFIAERLDQLIEHVGGKPGTFESRLIKDLLTTGLKLIPDGRHTGELKLITTAVKELRHAYRIFGQYTEPHKVSIFGSARTPKGHPDYTATVEFSKIMADQGWMVITGAGGGIMEAGHVGPGREQSFGVAIRLPFETTANDVIAGDQKLIHFRYFFTRKLMFMSQCEAVALFPGGFGTMDEAFEALTLVQTGKASMVPVVLCEGAGGGYWTGWDRFIREQLGTARLISPDDTALYYHAKDPADAARHIVQFYRNYRSSRYVKDDLVIRVERRLSDEALAKLNSEFGRLVKSGTMRQGGPLDGEDDALHLPRIIFHHTRRDFGLVRKLIDRVNELDAGQ
ncbi:MAG: LOG family protein [Phycisphaerales bacterium]